MSQLSSLTQVLTLSTTKKFSSQGKRILNRTVIPFTMTGAPLRTDHDFRELLGTRQLKLQLAPIALAGMSLRNVQQISSDVENHFKM